MRCRRLITLALFALLAVSGGAACTVEGPGSSADCHVSGCTVTFTRGVDAKASVLGIDAELVAVNGNTVTLKIAGQQVLVPVGETQPAQGLDVTVQEVTDEKVVIKLSTGITTTG
ncbi:hypothetical protein OG225_01090 [Nocardia sp. NBC_01377]|uniref:hypothetical protein n=1 Tax=Nocardia TaxID=1817 RepID=UPI001C22FD91|nr:hypothetical protein [Nocardia noduli]